MCTCEIEDLTMIGASSGPLWVDIIFRRVQIMYIIDFFKEKYTWLIEAPGRSCKLKKERNHGR